MEPAANRQVPQTREQLIRCLQTASELEHQLLCAYLYTAYSIKQDASEGGVNPDQVGLLMQWRSTITRVAVQEMLHLSLASNLLASITPEARPDGPFLRRQNFPLSPRFLRQRFGYNQPTGDAWLGLWPLDPATMRGYVWFESFSGGPFDGPTYSGPEEECRLQATDSAFLDEELEISTLVELYEAIATSIVTLGSQRELCDGKPLFCGDPDLQVSDQEVTPLFGTGQRGSEKVPLLNPVRDILSAITAVHTIITQGEGDTSAWNNFLVELGFEKSEFPVVPPPSHHSQFLSVLHQVEDLGAESQPARPVLVDQAAPGFAGEIEELFDQVYVLMIDLLAAGFELNIDREAGAGAQYERTTLVQAALRSMIYVLSPFGNALTQVPTEVKSADGTVLNAAPRFRNHAAPRSWSDLEDRLRTLSQRATELAAQAPQLSVWLTPSYLGIPDEGHQAPQGTLRQVLEENVGQNLGFLSERLQRVRGATPTAAPDGLFHVCQGLNECRGLDIDGSTQEAGSGNCATANPHVCSTLNDCQHQGGCGFTPPGSEISQDHPGANSRAGDGACGSPILPSIRNTAGQNIPGGAMFQREAPAPGGDGSVWRYARILFEQRMQAKGQAYGPSQGPGKVGGEDFPGWKPEA